MLRQAFARLTAVGSNEKSESDIQRSIQDHHGAPGHLPNDVRIFKFQESFFFPNAQHLKTKMLDDIQTHHGPNYSSVNGSERERNWSVVGERRVKRLRKKAGVSPDNLPAISLVILDFGRVNFFDVTAMTKLKDFIGQLKRYAGQGVEMRFVDCNHVVRNRLRRGQWETVDADNEEALKEGIKDNATKVYSSVQAALQNRPGSTRSESDAEIVEVGMKNDEKV